MDLHTLPKIRIIGNVGSAEVSEAENTLGFALPGQIKRFIEEYGAISYKAHELFGLGVKPESHLHIVQRTLEMRNADKKFPAKAVLIEDLGDGHYAICKQDGSVWEWAYHGGEVRLLAANFDAYMKDLIGIK